MIQPPTSYLTRQFIRQSTLLVSNSAKCRYTHRLNHTAAHSQHARPRIIGLQSCNSAPFASPGLVPSAMLQHATKFHTSSSLRHGHLTPPRPGEE
jgi:hypothetical protein